jgi:hypothetical protein
MQSSCPDADPLTNNALQVQRGEPFGSSQLVQIVISQGQCGTVFLCDIIQFPVVYAEAQVPVLSDENDGG